jgi:hypothetical protein
LTCLNKVRHSAARGWGKDEYWLPARRRIRRTNHASFSRWSILSSRFLSGNQDLYRSCLCVSWHTLTRQRAGWKKGRVS